MSFETVDLVLQDIGTSGHTQFENEEDLVDIFIANPHFRKCRMGLIHSHNVMPTFFSGEDISELEDNSIGTDFYLSLIVNNKFSPKAKIAFREKVVSNYSGSVTTVKKLINGKEIVKVEDKKEDSDYDIMYHTDLKVFFNIPEMQGLDRDLFRYEEAQKKRVALLPPTIIPSEDINKFPNPKWGSKPKQEKSPANKKDKNSGPPYFVSERQQKLGFSSNPAITDIPYMMFEAFLAKLITLDYFFEGTLDLAFILQEKKLNDNRDTTGYEELIVKNATEYFDYTTDYYCKDANDVSELYKRIILTMMKFQNELSHVVYLTFSKELKDLTLAINIEE